MVALNIPFPVSLMHALRTMKVEIMWHGLRTVREHALYLICLIRSSFPSEFNRQACSLCHDITCAYSETASKQAELKWFNSWKEGKFKLYLNEGKKKLWQGELTETFQIQFSECDFYYWMVFAYEVLLNLRKLKSLLGMEWPRKTQLVFFVTKLQIKNFSGISVRADRAMFS